MVLEQLFHAKWLEQKLWITFLLGFVYAELGIISALLVFPQNPSLISIGFISLLILPSLNSLLGLETNEDLQRKRFSLKGIFRDHTDILVVYAMLFLGILLAYGFFAILLPQATTERVFQVQLDIYKNSAGQAIANLGAASSYGLSFWGILLNNFKVIMVCLVFSLVYGAGSILFLTWNASVWGTIFGYVAKKTAFLHSNLAAFFIVLLKVLPHMFTEALAYFLAVFAGGIISKAVIREKMDSKNFSRVLTDGIAMFVLALVVLVVAAWLEVYIFPLLNV